MPSLFCRCCCAWRGWRRGSAWTWSAGGTRTAIPPRAAPSRPPSGETPGVRCLLYSVAAAVRGGAGGVARRGPGPRAVRGRLSRPAPPRPDPRAGRRRAFAAFSLLPLLLFGAGLAAWLGVDLVRGRYADGYPVPRRLVLI